MSLLLEALKKAEKAKEQAQRSATGGDATELTLDPDSARPDAGKHVVTRDELPDISASSLEILKEDLLPAEPKAPPRELSLELDAAPPAPEPKAAARREPTRAVPEAQLAERSAAKKVFEAKFKEPNPRLPFYVAVGVLATFTLGTGVYFWIQLRPPASLVNANPPRPSGESPTAITAAKPAATVPEPQTAAPPQIPGLPGAPTAAAPSVTPSPPARAESALPLAAAIPAAPAAKPVAAAPVATPAAAAPLAAGAIKPPAATGARRARDALERAPSDAERALRVSRVALQIHPRVQAGYAAYNGGDLTAARTAYEQVLREEPTNRDALLGLAAVEMRAQRYDASDAYYQRLLQANPRDAYAQAGMLALRAQIVDPVQAESRIKTLLAGDPEAGVLHFALGNQYAQQARWAEAQQSYFKAYATDPDNPDFAFNLAVSLDQLRQGALALEYYRRALALAEKRVASFAAEAAQNRAQQLSR